MGVARIPVVGGDGIGTEVTAQARKVIEAVLPDSEFDDYDLGARLYHRTGEILPQSVQDELAGHDAIPQRASIASWSS
jgi:3-isopropylmalate dehydrogenase